MPIYEYECQSHGVFEVMKSMSAFATPESCPSCHAPGARILSSPNLACLSPIERVVRDRNERASHEPRRGNRAEAQGKHAHHGHHHRHDHPQGKPGGQKGGLTAYTGKRPWVIEHG